MLTKKYSVQRAKKKKYFVEWIPNNMKESIYYVLTTGLPICTIIVTDTIGMNGVWKGIQG